MVELNVTAGYLGNFNAGVLSGLAPSFQWFIISIAVTLFIVFIYGLVLAISRALSMAELERHAKGELLNAGATILMVIFLVMILQSVDGFIINRTFCPGGSCIALPCGSLSVQINNSADGLTLLQCRMAQKAADSANLQQQVVSASATSFFLLNMNFGLLGTQVFNGYFVPSWYSDAETYRLINQMLTTFIISTNVTAVLAQYVKNNMLVFFLPVGLFLRSFYFTRGIGAFFMSLAIGLYFIFPVVYIMTDPGFVQSTYKAPQVPSTISNTMCYPTFSGVVYAIYSSSTPASSSSGSGSISLGDLRQNLADIYLSILIQPFVAFALSLVIIRYMMYVLGGEAQDLLRAVAKTV